MDLVKSFSLMRSGRVALAKRMFRSLTGAQTKALAASSDTQWSLDEWCEANGKTLVIVESPAKAKTIQRYLDSDEYVVDYSAGHVRDLPSKLEKAPANRKKQVILPEINLNVAHLGVDVEDKFEPIYVTMTKKIEVVKRLKKVAKTCSRIILASDEDREGEAISWHLVKLLEPSVPYKRAVFHEITKEAIIESFQNPRDIDMNLVQSQETRRVLDRLAGYTVSPILWRYIATGLSAGRVQSCGLHLIAEREKKRWNFVSSKYFSVTGTFLDNQGRNDEPRLNDSRLLSLDGRRVADDKDFDGSTGELILGKSDENTIILTQEKAMALMKTLANVNARFEVSDVTKKKTSRTAPKPFITSTLQQTGSSKLRLSPSETMRIAQELYEEGYITYMRTDSPTLSMSASTISRKIVLSVFGDKYVADNNNSARENKRGAVPKNAQEAHEAIRPAEYEGSFRSPSETGLEGKKMSLYRLIYQRTLASVMQKANFITTTYTVTSNLVDFKDCEFNEASFRSSETEMLFSGFNEALHMTDNGTKGVVKGAIKTSKEELMDGQQLWLSPNAQAATISSYDLENEVVEMCDPEDNNGGQDGTTNEEERRSEDDNSPLTFGGLRGISHVTRPPNRFSEASFIKELETIGVGRPSTYSKVIETLRSAERKYVIVEGHSIIPTITGLIVNDFLQTHFPDLTLSEFTAQMEESLDLIAQGKKDKVEFLTNYYLGSGESNEGLLNKVKEKLCKKEIDHTVSRTLEFPPLEGIGTLRIGSSGAFFELQNGTSSEEEKYNSSSASHLRWKLPEGMQVDIRKITRGAIEDICATETTMAGATLGESEEGAPVTIRSGRYGKFLQVGRDGDKSKQYFSLPRWIDGTTITLDNALEFASLPREIGEHPEFRDEQGNCRQMIVEVSSGAVTVGIEGYPFRMPVDEGVYPSEITFESAADFLFDINVILDSQRNLGTHNGEEVSIRKGRFGYYVRCGKLIAGLRKQQPSDISLEGAIEMIETRGKEISSGRKKSKNKAKAKSKAKVKPLKKKKSHTLSPYMNFCRVHREAVKTGNPEATFGELSKLLGGMWKQMSDAQKEEYKSEESKDIAEKKIRKKVPASPYINFCKIKRQEIKLANPAASFGELSKLLGAEWKKMTDAQKMVYKATNLDCPPGQPPLQR